MTRPALHSLITYLNEDVARSVAAVASMQDADPVDWPRLLTVNPSWRSINLFRDLLERAHDELDSEPRDAFRMTRFVIGESRRLAVPADAALLALQVRGRAWREHGSALRALHRRPAALAAAHRAIRLLSKGALVVEQTAARTLKALVLHDMGNSEDAIALLHECGQIFAAHEEPRRELQVVVMLGVIYFERDGYEDAQRMFLVAYKLAQEINDTRELPRILNNLGHCAAALDHPTDAWSYFTRAAAGFAAEGMDAELPRSAWGIAKLLRDAGATAHALQYLDRVYTAFRQRGMVLEAAKVILDVAVLLLPTAAPLAQQLCAEMLTLFATAGLQEEAIAALQYLRDQVREAADLRTDITHVRGFLTVLAVQPHAIFAVPGH